VNSFTKKTLVFGASSSSLVVFYFYLVYLAAFSSTTFSSWFGLNVPAVTIGLAICVPCEALTYSIIFVWFWIWLPSSTLSMDASQSCEGRRQLMGYMISILRSMAHWYYTDPCAIFCVDWLPSTVQLYDAWVLYPRRLELYNYFQITELLMGHSRVLIMLSSIWILLQHTSLGKVLILNTNTPELSTKMHIL